MAALENLERNGADHGREAIAEQALRDDHEIEQRRRRCMTEGEKGQQAEHEAQASHRPHPFSPDPVRKMAEPDLSGDGDQTHESKRPGRVGRAESDLDQILRLMDLHRVPGEEAEEVSHHDPPEARRTERAGESPVDGHPRRVHHVGRSTFAGRGARGLVTVRLEPQVGRPVPQQEIERHQYSQHQQAQRPAGGAPAGPGDEGLQPGQQRDRAHADAGKG